jgi:hypothetical protein
MSEVEMGFRNNIDVIKEQINRKESDWWQNQDKYPIIPNAFATNINGLGIVKFFYWKNIVHNVKSITVPGLNIQLKDNGFSGSGLIYGTPNAGTFENVKMDIYNTGQEYVLCLNEIYKGLNPFTNTIGYHSELVHNAYVRVYNPDNTPRFDIEMMDCIFTNLGPLTFSYEEEKIQTFSIEMAVSNVNFTNDPEFFGGSFLEGWVGTQA